MDVGPYSVASENPQTLVPSVVSDGSAAFLIYANSHHASGCVWAARSDPALVDTNTNKVSQLALLCYYGSFSTTSMAATSRSNAPTCRPSPASLLWLTKINEYAATDKTVPLWYDFFNSVLDNTCCVRSKHLHFESLIQ